MEVPLEFQKMAERGLRVDTVGLSAVIESRRETLINEKIRLTRAIGCDPWARTIFGGSANKERLKTVSHPEALNVVSFRERDRVFKNLVSMQSRVKNGVLKWEWTVAGTTRYYATGGLLTVSRECRNYIIPWESENFYLWDYKAQELRIIAVVTKSPRLWDILLSGKDFHEIISRISNRSRDDAKTINYAYMYGMEVAALKKIFHLNDKQMRMIESLLPMQILANVAEERANWVDHTLETYFGTKMSFEESKHLGPYYMQGTGADLLRRAVKTVMTDLGIWINITIHDALLTESDNSAIGEAMHIEIEGMPFPVEMKTGPTWGAVT